MRSLTKVILSFAGALALGALVYWATDSTVATSIVGVLAMAAGIAALALKQSAGGNSPSIRSRIRVGSARGSKVTGVVWRGKRDSDIDSRIRVRRADNGEVTGVRED